MIYIEGEFSMTKRSHSLDSLIAVREHDNTNIIGKLLYFTIGKTLIKEDRMGQIIEECGISKEYLASKFTNTHAFKSATKQLEKKYKVDTDKGNIEIYKIRILDNAKENSGNLIVREIKREIISEKKNPMISLGNLTYDKTTDDVNYDLNPVTIEDLDFDLKAECEKVFDLYEYSKDCYNENRIVNLIESYVTQELDASPISIHGKLFFVPIFRNEELAKLEQLIATIEEENEVTTRYGIDGNIHFATIPVMSDEKYIKEYTKEFYVMAEREIETYMKRFNHFIENGQTSDKILEVWIDKVDKFVEKKKKYEDLFKRNLCELDSDISIIERQIQELTYRVSKKEQEENKGR